MTITQSYGSYNTYSRYELTVEEGVHGALDEMPDIDLGKAVQTYRDAINAALPDSVSLCGNEFYGPAYEHDCDFDGYPMDEDGSLDIAAIIDGIDFWEIVEGGRA